MLTSILQGHEKNTASLTQSENELITSVGLNEFNIPRKMTPEYKTKLLELAKYIQNLTESKCPHDSEHYDVWGQKDIYDRMQNFKKEFKLN